MSTILQHRRGTTAQHSTFAGAAGEITVDSTKNTAVVHDGTTAGGWPLAKITDLQSSSAGYAVDTGTANTYQAAYSPAVTTVVDGMVLRFRAKTANTGASTFAPNGLAAAPIWGADHAALGGGEIIANGDVWVQWNSALNGSSGAWLLIDSTGGYIKSPTAPQFDNSQKVATTAYADRSGTSKIQPVTASVATNALTLTLNPTTLDFRSSALSSGTVNTRSVSAPISVTVPSTATLGTVSGQAARLILLALDNAGTVELAVVNLAGGVNLDETTLISTTAISAAATSASTIYSTTARTNVPFRVVGFIDITEATAGTWTTAPTTIQGTGGQALASIGNGTWQSVSRVAGTTYYNTRGKQIFIRAGTSSGGVTSGNLTIGSMTFGMIVNASSNYAAFPVPAGAAYSFTGSIDISHELF